MKQTAFLIIFTLVSLFVASLVSADPIFLTTIPLECNKVEEHLHQVVTPNGFKVSVLDAHKLAMKASTVIKPCASKLEQTIYVDKQYYYFTNSVLIGKRNFADKFVKVDGFTGVVESTF